MSGKSKAPGRGVPRQVATAEDPESGPPGPAYLQLVESFPLRPIESETELDRAVEAIDGMLRKGDLTEDESKYLDILSDLVEQYEDQRHPIPLVSGQATLRFFLDQWRMTPAQLSEKSGLAPSIISGILSGKRSLSRKHRETLATVFHVTPDLFLNS
jgi:HTH-type transcriptional regulator/antitoxin HigA